MYLGVDLGTSSLKVLLCDAKGIIVDTAKVDYPCYYPKAGWSEQNPDDWYNAFVSTFAKLKTKNDITQIKSISFCGQMHGLVLLDQDDKVIRPALLWNDSRSTVETDFINHHFGDKLLQMTGNIAFTGLTAPKLLWVKNNEPANFAKINKIMLPKDYLLYKSSGIFASDVSDNSGTLYFDVQNKCWQKDILALLNITEQQLPQIFESYQSIGTVSQTFAQTSGLAPTTKIVAGGGDQAVGAIGTGTVGDGRLNISLGTSGVVFASTNQYKPSTCKGLHNFAHSDGNYHFMGCILACAASADFWLKTILNTNDYATEFVACQNAPQNDIIFLPYLSGERSPINDPNAKGVFYGLQISHTRPALTRAVIEGICFALKDCLENMKSMGLQITPNTIATAIGGLTQSSWVLKILSTILDINIRTLKASEGGAYGAVILAMVGDNLYPNVQQACQSLVQLDQTISPDKTQTNFYNNKFLQYKTLYQKLKD